jgi:CheY-like chemotaxis protein
VLKRTRVLVIDDNDMSREIVAGHLKSWGVTVREAACGQEALQILGLEDRGEFDALIIDVVMPKMDGLVLAETIRGRRGFSDIPILMMSTVAAAPGPDEAIDGLTGWIGKPVRRSQLHSSLASLMATKPAEVTASHSTPSKRLPVIEQPPREQSRISRVLLVEDNPVNQELAHAMLVELGVEVVAAWSGEEALVKLAADQFEAVLMDCQMPKLDGYATTRRLREWERRAGRDRTPVIALTANALNGDAARCFEAGMDRYLSKPFTIEQLFGILESCVPDTEPHGKAQREPSAVAAPPRVMTPPPPAVEPPRVMTPPPPAVEPPRVMTPPPPAVEPPRVMAPPPPAVEPPRVMAPPPPAVEPPAAPAPSGAVPPRPRVSPTVLTRRPVYRPEGEVAALDQLTLDRIRELHRRGGPNLLDKMAELYSANSRRLLDEARQALGGGDVPGTVKAIHALKSSSSSIGATELADLCDVLESAGREERVEGAEAMLGNIITEHARVMRALAAISVAA